MGRYKSIYLSYVDTVKTEFEICGILGHSVAIIAPLATYNAENGVSNGLNLHAAWICGELLRSTLEVLFRIFYYWNPYWVVVYFRAYLAHGCQQVYTIGSDLHLLLTSYCNTNLLKQTG